MNRRNLMRSKSKVINRVEIGKEKPKIGLLRDQEKCKEEEEEVAVVIVVVTVEGKFLSKWEKFGEHGRGWVCPSRASGDRSLATLPSTLATRGERRLYVIFRRARGDGMHMHARRLMDRIEFPQLPNRWQTTTNREQFYASFRTDGVWLRCGFPKRRLADRKSIGVE